jgi:hypothetical protein
MNGLAILYLSLAEDSVPEIARTLTKLSAMPRQFSALSYYEEIRLVTLCSKF